MMKYFFRIIKLLNFILQPDTVTNFSSIVLFSVGDKLSFIVPFSVHDKLFIHRTIQCWWQTFHPSYYAVLVTNFSSIVLFSVGDKLFIHRTIQCWWQTFHPSYYLVLVTNFSSIVLYSVGDKLCIYHHWIWWQYLVT